jgi:hypothetical protein
MSNNDIELLLTTAEAIATIKKAPRGRSDFALHIRADAPIAGKDDRIFAHGLSGHINLSRPEALKLVGDLLSEGLEARGARIPIRLHKSEYSNVTTYWLL